MIIDQQADKSKAMLFLVTGKITDAALRAKLRGANIDTKKINALKDASFAYPSKRLFPVDTKDNTLLSMVYFSYQEGLLPADSVISIKRSLEVHAKLHNIQTTFPSLKANTSVKVASENKHNIPARYLLPDKEFCKVANCKDLEVAQEMFDKDFTKLQLSDRVTFSTNFIKAARDFSAPITSVNIEKYAGVLDYNAAHTQYALELRMGMASRRGGDNSSEPYHKLAEDLKGLTEKPTQDELRKLASMVEALDKHTNITEKDYDTKIHSPHGVVFCKTAEESSETTEGKSEELTKADIIGKFGEGALDSVEEEDGTINKKALNKIQGLSKGLANANKNNKR